MIQYTARSLPADPKAQYIAIGLLIEQYRELVEHIPNWHVEFQEGIVNNQPMVKVLMSFETIFELAQTDTRAKQALKYAAGCIS
jgi:hypothetical protein